MLFRTRTRGRLGGEEVTAARGAAREEVEAAAAGVAEVGAPATAAVAAAQLPGVCGGLSCLRLCLPLVVVLSAVCGGVRSAARGRGMQLQGGLEVGAKGGEADATCAGSTAPFAASCAYSASIAPRLRCMHDTPARQCRWASKAAVSRSRSGDARSGEADRSGKERGASLARLAGLGPPLESATLLTLLLTADVSEVERLQPALLDDRPLAVAAASVAACVARRHCAVCKGEEGVEALILLLLSSGVEV